MAGMHGRVREVLRSARELVRAHRMASILAGLLLLVAGIDLLLNPSEGRSFEPLALPVLAAGVALLGLALFPDRLPRLETKHVSLAAALLHRLTWGGRLRPYFPVLGVGLIALDLLYNWTLSATPELLETDTIFLLLGGAFLVYNFVPASFARERDFAFLFFLALVVILVLPLMLARLYYGDFEKSVDGYSWVALAPQVSFLLKGLGVQNTIVSNPAITNAPGLLFTPLAQQALLNPTPHIVFITTACSGIYSFGIFASAFASFVLTEYRKLDRRIGLLLLAGVFAAYVANVLRMVVIVYIGYRYDVGGNEGLQAMAAAHSNAGWLIFLAWVSLFWLVVFKVIGRRERGGAEQPAAKRGVVCGLCGEILKVDVPATRCTCGRFYHRACLADAGRCPACQTPAAAAALSG